MTTVTLQGNPLELIGEPVAQGQPAPDFTCLDNELKEKRLADFAGRVLVLAAVPSLDTPVCDLETRRFNQEAVGLGDDVQVVVVSCDLPFAQKRWCGQAGVERVLTLSDHRDTSFGRAYGVLIPALRLLARAVFVVDRSSTVVHSQLVPEIAEEPDYDAVLAAVRRALG